MKFLLIIFLLIAPAAQAFELGMPIDCHYGKDCFIQNYYDEDSSPDYHDYMCGRLTYDGHDGTDFRLRDYAAMNKGVNVIAAAAGTVIAARDGMQDINVRKIDAASIDKEGCGNAVFIAHANGYKTLYCHMKKGSIVVKKGDVVAKGEKLGEVGLSGNTAFPHVHLGVMRGDKTIDPFTGGQSTSNCESPRSYLWDEPTHTLLKYIPSAVLATSFTDRIPTQEEASNGIFTEEHISPRTPILILWAETMGLLPGDHYTMSITSPAGVVIATKDLTFNKNQALYFEYIGIKNKVGAFPIGTYIGRIEIIRRRKNVLTEERKVVVE